MDEGMELPELNYARALKNAASSDGVCSTLEFPFILF